MPFQHQKLLVYQRALEFMTSVVVLVSRAGSGWPDLIDQLKRAATSVLLNIAEGAGEFSPGEKVRFYRMAIRSAAECDAALEILVRVKLFTPEQTARPRELLEEIASMLVAMCKRVESRPDYKPSRSRSRSRSR